MNVAKKSTAVIFVFLASAVAWGQGTGQINGTVKDTTGLAVPAAEVRATQTATNAVRTVVTNAAGGYVLPNLPTGPYQIEVTKEGFAKGVQAGIVLEVNSSPTVDFNLKLGAVSEEVVVEANAVSVETQTTGVGQVIDNQRVLELPLNARDSQQLIILAGGAVGGGNQNSNRTYPVNLISVGGAQSDQLTYTLDGGTHNEPYVSGPMPLPFPDALQEFKVETSSVPAQYGQHPGGAVSAVTKSGTNQFHGTLFEFLRNGKLNARNAFAQQRDLLKRNQFGGVIGGPIVPDKLFFFFGDQGTITRAVPTPVNAFVPTADMLQGDYSTFMSAACNGGTAKTLKGGFVNNRISPAQFAAPSVALVSQPNWPVASDPCGKVTFNRANNSDEQFIIGRIDYQHSFKSSIFGRYMIGRRNEATDYDGRNLLSLSSPAYVRRAHSLTLGNTYLLSNTIVSSFRATLLRTVNNKDIPDFFTLNDLGVNGFYYPDNYSKMAIISATGNFSLFPAPITPGKANSKSIQIAEDINMSLGAHQIAFGVNFIHAGVNYQTGTNTPGSVNFRTSLTGHALGDMMLGRVFRWQQSQLSPWYVRNYYTGLYIQDSWRATSRLTVMAGLRWEPYLAPYTKYVQSGVFSYDWYQQGLRSSVFQNAPAGLLFGDDPQVGTGNKMDVNNWGKFGPRLGISWDPFGDGKTVIRAAGGIFYDYAHLDTYRNHLNAPPTGGRASLSGVNFGDPWANYPGGSPFPLVFGPDANFLPRAVYQTIPRGLKRPYVEQWNFSVQRQIGSSWLASATYLGNLAIHGTMGHEGNPATYLGLGPCTINGTNYSTCSTTGNTNERRVLSLLNPNAGEAYANVAFIDDSGTRTYQGMMLSLQRRAARGVTILANYTWSHCIDTGGATATNELQTFDPTQQRNNRGNCELDRRHNFNLSTVYRTPRFQSNVARALGSGWQISLITRAISGPWLSVDSGSDRALTGAGGQYADVTGSPYAENRGVATGVWLNPDAFSLPALGSYGNMSARSILGPGGLTFDIAVARVFQFTERLSLQLRGEAFNLANHVNPGNRFADVPSGVDTDFSSPQFGRIVSAGDPRIMQVAAKLSF